MRRCIHNRSDTLALSILRILACAMYEESRLFIVEEVKGSPPSVDGRHGRLDLSMEGRERSGDDWEWMTARAGLKIISVGDGVGSWGELAATECVKSQPAEAGLTADAGECGKETPVIPSADDTPSPSKPTWHLKVWCTEEAKCPEGDAPTPGASGHLKERKKEKAVNV